MKKILLLLFFAVSFLTGCEYMDESSGEYQAARIMCDIDGAINLHRRTDEGEIHQSLYDFSDLFSEEAYQKMGDLTGPYEAIRSYFGSWLESFDLLEADRAGDTVKGTYKITTGQKKESYLYFVANAGDSMQKRGLQVIQIADARETLSKDRACGYGIVLNGESLSTHSFENPPSFRKENPVYENKVDFSAGDADALAKETGEQFMKYLRTGQAEEIKNMFSGSVWRYDKELDAQIGALIEYVSDFNVSSIQINSSSEEGATTSGSLKDSSGSTHRTRGHGSYRITVYIQLETESGEKELSFDLISEYEPNPAREGIWKVSLFDENREEWVDLAGLE